MLAEAGESIERFFASGMAELGDKLGPIVWQFATTKVFDPRDFGAFLGLLPQRLGAAASPRGRGAPSSFMVPDFVALARKHRSRPCFADSDEYPSFAELDRRLRLCATDEDGLAVQATGYTPQGIAAGRRRQGVAAGQAPAGLLMHRGRRAGRERLRDVFLFFISGAKERAPAAAMATLDRLGSTGLLFRLTHPAAMRKASLVDSKSPARLLTAARR